MLYQVIAFVLIFVATGIIHGPLKAHKTDKFWIKAAHKWAEVATVVQGIIVINELLKMI
jgi:hypothetical protein